MLQLPATLWIIIPRHFSYNTWNLFFLYNKQFFLLALHILLKIKGKFFLNILTNKKINQPYNDSVWTLPFYKKYNKNRIIINYQ